MIEKIQACLAGVMLGDALGMPWESLSYDEIQKRTCGNGVTGFADPIQTKIKDTKNLSAGQTTDDWQLTKIVAQSLIDVGKFDRFNIAMQHVETLEKSNVGWGNTTEKSIRLLKSIIEEKNYDALAFTIFFSSEPGMASTGIAMKIAPIALYCVLQHKRDYLEPLIKYTIELGSLTHKDPRATTAACALGICICECLIQPVLDLNRKAKIIAIIQQTLNKLENLLPCNCPPNELTSYKLTEVMTNRFNAKDLSKLKPDTFFAPTAVAVSMSAFFANPRCLRDAVLNAINVGGDTDTLGSMAGALVGANDGLGAIPSIWMRFRPEYQEALEIGKKLYLIANYQL